MRATGSHGASTIWSDLERQKIKFEVQSTFQIRRQQNKGARLEVVLRDRDKQHRREAQRLG